MAGAKLLIIDDEQDIRTLLQRILKLEGYEVDTAADYKSGLRKAVEGAYHVCICDVRLPDGDGIELTREIKEKVAETEVIQLTANGSITDGVRAIKFGAYDYLQKGDDNQRMLPLIERAVEKARSQMRLARIAQENDALYGFDRVVGNSPLLVRAKQLAQQVAATDATVLITGPTGTGKEVFAKAIHYTSPRRRESFVAINCAAVSRDLLESEMFGHAAGAFTGATRDKQGLFEEANGGTIFLDELGEMDLALQAKLLRILEDGSFLKVGTTQERRVDVRVLAATNRDLLKEAESGRFRADLYYRLSTFAVALPSLVDRPDDIPVLAQFFVERIGPGMRSPVKAMNRDFEQALLRHSWPGNVRELRNFIERCLILAKGSELTAQDLPAGFGQGQAATLAQEASANADTTQVLTAAKLSEVERLHIERVMHMTGGNKSRAAELLGIGVTTLYRKLQEYGLH